MPTNYQADETGAESPAAAPSWTNAAADFLLALPIGNEGGLIANLYQSLKACANYAVWTKNRLKDLVTGGLLSMKSLKIDGTGAQAWVNSFGRGLWVSAGDVLFGANLEVDGATNLGATEIRADETLDGHLLATTGLYVVPPTATPLGTGTGATISGSDVAGLVEYSVGATAAPASIFKVNFGTAFAAAPKMILLGWFTNDGTWPLGTTIDVIAKSTTDFTVHATGLNINTTYGIFYLVIG